MTKGKWITLGAVVLIAIVSLWAWRWTVNVNYTEVQLNRGYQASDNVVETTMDTMRKAIMNVNKGCTKAFADTFIKAVAAQAAPRAGGSLFKSNTEAANKLGITSEMYMKLANTIEGQLAALKRAQDTRTDKWVAHTTWCEDPDHNMLWVSLIDKVKPKPEMISSTISKEAMKTKKLDDNLLGD